MAASNQKHDTAVLARWFGPEDQKTIVPLGRRLVFAAGDWIFHESMPREGFGIIEEGEVEILRGTQGAQTCLAALGPGAMLSEGALFGEAPHSASAFTRTGASIFFVPRASLTELRETNPEAYYRIVSRVAQRLMDRLCHASSRMAGDGNDGRVIGSTRNEHDLLGERELPDDAYYGIQTLRATENFPFSGIRVRDFDHLVRALAYVKKAAAQANSALGVLGKDKARAICAACDEIASGQLRDGFVVDMIQGGAGTSTNMNANEVIANRGLELLGHARGEYQYLHPNDDVNASQSTNDVYPTAIKLAVILALQDTLSAMADLKAKLEAKAVEFSDVLKMGRTENQDAVPMTLGQEFGAYATMIDDGMRALRRAADELHEINMGATAIGTGINSPPEYAELVTRKLARVSGIPVRKADNLVEATQDSGSFAQMSASMKRAAVQLSKICNDLRWLSSGPRCGLHEITLPPMQPGSSIMPGKVNPVIPEVVNQICYQIIGYDVAISMASEASELELNMAEPIIAFDLLHGLMLLKKACVVLATRCVEGIEANREQCRRYVEQSIGLVTALNPVLGYERSVEVAKEALDTGRSVYELVLEKGWLTRQALDELLRPEKMTHPRRIPA